MSIGNVIQRGNQIVVFDTNGRQIAFIGVSPKDELKGYTASTINVKRGSAIYTYDEKGVVRHVNGA